MDTPNMIYKRYIPALPLSSYVMSTRTKMQEIGLGQEARRMLHLTNGSSTGNTLMRARLGGAVLCWNDVLHEGPVPAHLALDELSRVRAAFIAENMNLDAHHVAGDFVRR